MTMGSKFNVGINNITIDTFTLYKYKIILADYIKTNNLWDQNTRECWLYDLIDYKLKGDLGLCYKTIRILEQEWGFDSDKDDIDDYITRHMAKFNAKVRAR